MPSFRHKRTGKIVTVDAQDAFRFNNARYELVSDDAAVGHEPISVVGVAVPSGTVAEVLKWAGDDPVRRAAALKAEKNRKNSKGVIESRKTIIEALS